MKGSPELKRMQGDNTDTESEPIRSIAEEKRQGQIRNAEALITDHQELMAKISSKMGAMSHEKAIEKGEYDGVQVREVFSSGKQQTVKIIEFVQNGKDPIVDLRMQILYNTSINMKQYVMHSHMCMLMREGLGDKMTHSM